MSIRPAFRMILRNVFVDSIGKRASLARMGIDINDELSSRLHVLGGLAEAW